MSDGAGGSTPTWNAPAHETFLLERILEKAGLRVDLVPEKKVPDGASSSTPRPSRGRCAA